MNQMLVTQKSGYATGYAKVGELALSSSNVCAVANKDWVEMYKPRRLYMYVIDQNDDRIIGNIQAGDWILDTITKKISQIIGSNDIIWDTVTEDGRYDRLRIGDSGHMKKIVATNRELVKYENTLVDEIPKNFQRLFSKLYNRGITISKVNVNYVEDIPFFNLTDETKNTSFY